MAASVTHVQFVVEGAGCESCAARVRQALAPLATVDDVRIDEQADVATVSLSATSIAEDDAVAALREASVGSGHDYRIKPGSWTGVASRLLRG